MRKFVLLLTIVILAGCSPTRRLARLLERYPIPETIDTLYLPGKTVYKDTTVYRYLPGETVTEKLYINVPIALPDTVLVVDTELASATADLTDNVLSLWLMQRDTLLQWKLDSAIREHSDTIVVIKDIPYPVIEKAKPFYKNGFFILAGLILISIVLLLLFRKK